MKNATRFLVTKGSDNAPRHYWQPTAQYRLAGWVTVRLDKKNALALGQACTLNEQLDKWLQDQNSIIPNGKAVAINPHQDSTACLIKAWQSSAAYTALAAATRKYYKTGVKYIIAEIGTKVVGNITPFDLQGLYNKLTHQPGTAAQVVRTGQAAWAWAIATGYSGVPVIKGSNPWGFIKLPTDHKSATLWASADVDAMVKAADTIPDENGVLMPSIGTAILMMEWLGHYPQDIIKMRKDNLKNCRFIFRRKKTKIPVNVKCSPRLMQRITEMRIISTVNDITTTHIIAAEHTSKPWKIDNFRKHFRRIRAAAALSSPRLANLKMGHIRHTAITNMFDADIPPMNIAAVVGTSLKNCEAILDRYNTRTAKQADTATTTRLLADERHR